MSLRTYTRKRDFSRTPEPSSPKPHPHGGHRFVVQQHDASRMHFDFRLELDGALKSWAVPKGPSMNPKDKRLAVQVEDHPVAYADFEGVIPKGQYGGGSVIIWDEGTWTPVNDPRLGLQEGKLTFILAGERLQGEWALVRLAKSPKNWLLIKHRDAAAQAGGIITQRFTRSVRSAQRVQEVGNAQASPMPNDVAPALATRVSQVPTGPGWLFELKWDGYRAITTVADGTATLRSRQGRDWSADMARVAQACVRLPCASAIVDGEVVVLDRRGVSRFAMLQDALAQGHQEALRYAVFDLLYLDGHDLRGLPLLARKHLLHTLVRASPNTTRECLIFSAHAQQGGEALFAAVGRQGLEGLIAKRQDAVYQSRRTHDWLKIKCVQGGEFYVGGFTPASSGDAGLGALLLGTRNAAGKLVYAGRVGTGFGEAEVLRLLGLLRPLQQSASPFVAAVPQSGRPRFVKPELVVSVTYTERTRTGALRHPSYQGLVSSSAKPAGPHASPPEKARPSMALARARLALKRVPISHPQRLLYPEAALRKADIAAYYAYMGEAMLVHIARRPLTLLRCPQGLAGASFWQRHVPSHMSRFVHQLLHGPSGHPVTYVDTVEGLVSLAQMGALEVHTWGCQVDDLAHADLLVFDLDPAPDVGWTQIVDAAHLVRETLERLDLRTFVRRTGGKGLHVVLPITPTQPFSTSFKFSHFVAVYLETRYPKLFTSHMQKKQRTGKIFIDYLRNRFSSSAIANYATRARPGAPVAWPLQWQQLNAATLASPFGVREALDLLQTQTSWQDPWEAMQHVSQTLSYELCKHIAAWHLKHP